MLLSKNHNFVIKEQSFSFYDLIYVFSTTFFSFFLLIITRKTLIFLFETTVLLYFRGFSLGVLISALMSLNPILTIIIIMLELIMNIFVLSIIINSVLNNIFIKTDKLILITVICVFVYSLLIEIVGGKLG